MDRKQQLRNVAFGGAWSQAIAEDEELAEAMACLMAAVEHTRFEDVRGFDHVREALNLICAAHPKGPMLAAAWWKALEIRQAGARSAELHRICSNLRAGLGVRLEA